MPTLSIQFTGGHYHATPWGRAHNEGAVEWPPSPWRVLRALIAAGYTKLPEWRAGVMPDVARTLFGKLARVPPAYRLPPASGMHTRHYMPIDARDSKNRYERKGSLVLDARAVPGVDHEPLLIYWDVELAAPERALLADLAEHLGYLGRAESWCEAKLVDDRRPASDWCVAEECSEQPGEGREQIPLMAAVTPEEFAWWREQALEEATTPAQKSAIPADLVEALQNETGELQRQGWTSPPGSRIVLYSLPARSAIGITRVRGADRKEAEPVEFVLLALASAARSRSPMPLVRRALPQAELLHRALASYVGRLEGAAKEVAARELLGIGSSGHRHAHLLPLGLIKDDKHLDHILVWAPGGISRVSQDILRRVRNTYMKGGVGELVVRFVGAGGPADFDGFAYMRPVTTVSKVWCSKTPLVLPRYRKRNGRNTLEGQIAAECESRGIAAPVRIEEMPAEAGKAMRHYVRSRRESQPPQDYGYALRLTFAEPVRGPLCLGYASHYGLGLFEAEEEEVGISANQL